MIDWRCYFYHKPSRLDKKGFLIPVKTQIRFALTLILLTAFLLPIGCVEKKSFPTAVNGVLDLSNWDFRHNGTVKLKGDWDIYWEKLLTPNDFSGPSPPKKTGVSFVPRYWEGQVVNGVPLHYRGYATLRLMVRMPADTTSLGLEIKGMRGALKIWLNGEILNECGTLGTTGTEVHEASGTSYLYPIRSNEQMHEFIVQIANFHMYPHFGALFSLSLGRLSDLRHENYLPIGIDLFMMGASITMAFYHLVLFVFRTQNRSNLYFGALCLLYGTWLTYNGVCSGEWFSALLPGVPWQARFIGSFFALVFMPVCLIMFVRSLFPRECSKAVVRLAQVVFAGWAFTSVLVPFSTSILPLERLFRVLYHPTIRPSEILLVGLAIYIIGVILLAAKRKRRGARFMLGSFSILFIAIVHDVVTIYYNPIFEFSADARKMPFRYSGLCGLAFDAAGAVKSEIPQGFKILVCIRP